MRSGRGVCIMVVVAEGVGVEVVLQLVSSGGVVRAVAEGIGSRCCSLSGRGGQKWQWRM